MIMRRRICAENESSTSPSKHLNMSLNIFVTISNNKIIPIMNTNIVMAILIIPIILIIMKTYLSGGEVLANYVGTRYVHHVQTTEKQGFYM